MTNRILYQHCNRIAAIKMECRNSAGASLHATFKHAVSDDAVLHHHRGRFRPCVGMKKNVIEPISHCTPLRAGKRVFFAGSVHSNLTTSESYNAATL